MQNNTTGPISSTESGPGATSNTASITVIGPPSIAKAFGAASINLNGTTTLIFTITNPNATVALTGVGFGDTLPAGLTIANPNGLTGSCGAGTITTGTVSGFSVVNLSGGTISGGRLLHFLRECSRYYWRSQSEHDRHGKFQPTRVLATKPPRRLTSMPPTWPSPRPTAARLHAARRARCGLSRSAT